MLVLADLISAETIREHPMEVAMILVDLAFVGGMRRIVVRKGARGLFDKFLK